MFIYSLAKQRKQKTPSFPCISSISVLILPKDRAKVKNYGEVNVSCQSCV